MDAFTRKHRHMVESWEQLFAAANAAHRRHKELWNKHFPRMGFPYKDSSAYNDQLAVFWSTFWRVEVRVRPVIRDLKLGHHEQVPAALAYLAVPRRHFRSGYNKEQILQALKHIALRPEEQLLIREIWQDVEPVLSTREKRKFRQLLAALPK